MTELMVKSIPNSIVSEETQSVSQNTALAPAAVTTVTTGGRKSEAVLIESGNLDGMNSIVQFTITNVAGDAVNQKIRIGSILGAPDSYALAGIGASAADVAGVVDNRGAGVKALQLFAQWVSFKPVIISKIKVMTAEADIQLNQRFTYNRLFPDGTIIPKDLNISFTAMKTDNRANLMEANVVILLDSTQYLEYTILAGKSVDIFLQIAAVSNTEEFSQIG